MSRRPTRILPRTTPRLRWRRLTKADLPFVSEMLGHPEVMRHYPKPLTREESAAWIERQLARYAADGHGLWLVERAADGAPVGQVGLLRQEVEGGELLEIAYLLHAPFWGQGYATEAAAAVRDLAFEVCGAAAVHSLIRRVNRRSQAVARRLGLAPVRTVDFHGYRHLLFQLPRPAPAAPAREA